MKRRKKVRVNFKNLFILICFVLVLVFLGMLIFKKFTSSENDSKDNGKTSEVKDEVKEHLSSLGYSKSDIKVISSNMSEEDIMSIDKKYDYLVDYLGVKYFHFENIDRYDKLMEEEDIKVEDAIMNVNIGIDKPFYTDIKTVSNPDDLLVLVNKYNALPSGIEPSDLIDVEGEQMQREAGEAMLKMVSDIRSEGLDINLLSGYRSEETQRGLYNNYVASDGKEEADTYSARPNHSEHQTGLAMDLSDGWYLEEYFEDTPLFDWLQDNCYKYGFILRYKKDKVYESGYVYEPWHYRYVGVEVATIIHNENLTFEEYYVKYKGLY